MDVYTATRTVPYGPRLEERLDALLAGEPVDVGDGPMIGTYADLPGFEAETVPTIARITRKVSRQGLHLCALEVRHPLIGEDTYLVLAVDGKLYEVPEPGIGGTRVPKKVRWVPGPAIEVEFEETYEGRTVRHSMLLALSLTGEREAA